MGQGPKRLLIDTGEGKPAWLASLKTVLASENASISQAILTHWHPDHVGGVSDLLQLSPGLSIFKHAPTADSTQQPIADGQRFATAGATLRAFHCPGHTTDHMALVLEDEDAMFTGDNVLGQGTAVFEDLAAYMDSLDGMQRQFAGRAYPGHGPVVEDGRAKIHEYIAHRREREHQVLGVMSGKSEASESESGGARGWKAMDLVKVIYKDYPENLHAPAEGGLLQVLRKLEKEGRVVFRSETDTWSLGSKPAL